MSRLVHVEMSSCRVPVAGSRDRDDGVAANAGRNEHCLVARKYSLTDCHFVPAVVDCLDVADAFDAIILIWKGLGDLAILVTECSSIHGFWIDISRPWLPLIHELTRRARVRAVGARGALLIWTQSPSSVQRSGSDGDQTCVLREFALSRPVHEPSLDQLTILSVSMGVVCAMPVMKVSVAQGRVRGLSGQRKQSRAG